MDNINDIHSVISNDIIWNLGKYMIIYIYIQINGNDTNDNHDTIYIYT